MPLAARRDPRLDPTLTPTEWAASRRRYQLRLGLIILVILALAGAAGYYYLLQRDRTREMTAGEVVEAAGMALVEASAYRFSATLTGGSPDGYFPDARLQGEYQREPLVIHLSGEAGSADTKMPIEYYLEGQQLYVKNPRDEGWMALENPDLEELYAFQPDNLAAPLLAGLRSAELSGREVLNGRETARYNLELDPFVMRIPEPVEGERIGYRLWVDTQSLRPARLELQVTRLPDQGASFVYRTDLDFGAQAPLAVPAEVKGAAGAGTPNAANSADTQNPGNAADPADGEDSGDSAEP